MHTVPLIHRFSFKVIAGVIAMLVLVGIPFFFLFLRYHRSQLLETMESSTTQMSRILAHQIEVSVLDGKHHELERVVQSLAGSGARGIMIVDRSGRVAVSSDPSERGRRLHRDTSPGCRECHMGTMLKDTVFLVDAAGRPFYRNVNVIQNKPRCFECHDSRSPVAGILVMDFTQDALAAQLRASVVRLVGMGGTMLVLTIVVLYVLLDQLVLRRLRKLADAAEQIGRAQFGAVALGGRDEFGQLGASFNLMSARLASAMKEIRGSKEYLESVINSIDDEILVIGRDFRIVTANAAYYRNRRGCSRLTPEDACCAEPEPSEAPGCDACAAALTFADGQVHKIVQSFVDAAGKERFIEAFACPLRGESGEVYQVIEVRRDITERKLLEANLAHSERLVSMGLLASGLAHEINNPLGSISTFVEGLKRRLRRDAPPRDGLEKSLTLILREIERAKEVTRRLLILAQKDESGCSLLNLNDSLQETASLIGYEARKLGIAVELECDPGFPTLKLPESQVRQVFLNLLLNSLQAGHRGGRVRCRTWRADGRAFASICDDGCGIDPADQIKIYEPFFSKKPAGQGTGLGLFISKSIVSSLGGAISVESSAGRGATFTLSFPVPR